MRSNKFRLKGMFTACMFFLVTGFMFSQKLEYKWEKTTSNGYSYEYVTHDPMKTRFFTLDNGLQVVLSENHRTPRIAVNIAVRTGSNTDPREHTGLAHYLEHILFKGTDKFGSLDWDREKPLLDKIEALYETYNSTQDTLLRKEIYQEIDKVSNEAAKYAIAGEYDKLMTEIGSEGTNAHTWMEETVYKENIPSNAIDKFLKIQAERFRKPVVRLFHTELEAVYEEKNRSLDNDGRKMNEVMNDALFPTHNYGQQTTIGTIEHLKNPSITAIKQYYDTYYVPNNMAIIMVGDFDADQMIKKVDEHFSYMRPKPVEAYDPAPEKPMDSPLVREVYGPSPEHIRLVWRSPAAYTKDAQVLNLITSILNNGKAGLFDININQKQKVQGAYSGLMQYKDYGVFMVGGGPKQGQNLEQVKTILLEELEKLKKGNFDLDLLKAIVANYKLDEQEALKSNDSRLNALLNVYIKSNNTAWDKDVAYLSSMARLTKEDIVRVANTYLSENYLTLYKRQGEDKNMVKVDKPPITPIETNAGKESPYVQAIKQMEVAPIAPKWIDFQKDLDIDRVGPTDLFYIQNMENDLFTMEYRFGMGSYNSKYLSIALNYLNYLATDSYTAEEINKKLYALASNYRTNVSSEMTRITITGLQENFREVVGLIEHIIRNCKPDEEALAKLKERIMKGRSDSKLEKRAILYGLTNYATYGAKNPFNDVLSNEEILAMTPGQLTDILHGLFDFEHDVIYYGPKTKEELKSTLNSIHSFPDAFKPYPEQTTYTYKSQDRNRVLFAHYDMVQSEIQWIRNTEKYDPEKEPMINLFNAYFGGGMGSVVFQTIRESKALAYATYAQYAIPSKEEQMFRMLAYVGSQSDKMLQAVDAMDELLDELPLNREEIRAKKAAIKQTIATQRIVEIEPIYHYLEAKEKGVEYDMRKKVHDSMDDITLHDIQLFHKEKLADKPYTYCIIGSEERISEGDLNTIGEVEKLTLEEIFGY